MLKDPRSSALVENFAGQWLSIRAIQTQVPVAGMFPDFDDNLRYAMRKEMEMFVTSMIQNDRPVTELLDANYTFVNERLAKHYGIPNVYGSYFRKVELPANLDYRRGLLGKALLMTVSSMPNRTSPGAARQNDPSNVPRNGASGSSAERRSEPAGQRGRPQRSAVHAPATRNAPQE